MNGAPLMCEDASVPPEMRALVLDGPGFSRLSVRNVPVPEPGPNELLARVDAAGICTSLIKLIEQGSQHSLVYGWDVGRFPLILGDEGSVTVMRVGTALAGKFRVGERCVLQPAPRPGGSHPPTLAEARYNPRKEPFSLLP